ncbi:MAG: hypothetical protein M1823_008946, partial [Watsoniomyces obsoletus]
LRSRQPQHRAPSSEELHNRDAALRERGPQRRSHTNHGGHRSHGPFRHLPQL